MNRSFRAALFLLTFLSTTPSFAASPRVVEPQPFMPPQGESIKTIALLTIPEPAGYFLGEGGLSAGGALIGIPAIVVDVVSVPNHPEYQSTDFHFSAVAERRLTEHLKAAGFSVVSVPVDREKPNQLLRDYQALSVSNVDAYLDVAVLGVGYRKSNSGAWPFAHKVGPYVAVAVRLVSARSKKILYADIIEYGWSKARYLGMETTEIDAPEDNLFANTKAVETDLMKTDSRSIAQLTQGIDIDMRTIVSAFSSYPAIELPQQAGSRPRTESPIEVAKAAPAAVPSPGTTIPKEATSKRYKIGIFPATGNFGMENRGTQENQSADIIRATISQNSVLDLRYSAYHSGLNMPQISAGSVWDYRGNRQEPRISAIRKLARERNLDAVVLARGDTPGGWGFGGGLEDPRNPVSLYLIIIETGRVFKRKGTFADVGRMAEQLLAGLLATHPTVVATTPQIKKGVKAVSVGQKPATFTPYKIATFPFGSDSKCIGESRPSDEKFASELSAIIARNDSLKLAYSYYDSRLNQPPIKKPGRLWNGSKPNLTQVFSLGQTQGVDAVVMYWRAESSPGIPYCTSRMPPFPVDVYVIDVKQRKTYAQKGSEEDVNALTKQTLSRFLAGVQSKVVATAPTQHAGVTSQTASSAGAFEGITLPAGGSVKAINAAAEAYCGSLNKQSRLVAAPPNSPNYVFQCYQPTKASTPAARTTVAKAAPEIRQGTASYKIGIFPAGGDFATTGAGTPWDEKYSAQVLANHLRANASSLSLTYSHYDPGLNQPPIYDYAKVWAGSKPKLPAIYREAETRHLDAVFLYRGMGWWRGYGSAPSDPMPIELYLIDVKQKRTYAQKGDTDRLENMEDGLISRLLQGQAR
jgi:hypothetical protein